MKRQVFSDETEELAATIRQLDGLIAVLAVRLRQLADMRDQAIRLQVGMQTFADMLDANEAAANAEAMDEAGTHPRPPLAN